MFVVDPIASPLDLHYSEICIRPMVVKLRGRHRLLWSGPVVFDDAGAFWIEFCLPIDKLEHGLI